MKMSRALEEMKRNFLNEFRIPEDYHLTALNHWNEYASKNSFKDIWHLQNGMKLFFMGFAMGINSHPLDEAAC